MIIIKYKLGMKHEQNTVSGKFNITVTVSEHELSAIDAYLRPFCGSRGPFIRQLVLDKIGYTPAKEAEK